MIIGNRRSAVIENIKKASDSGNFNIKVELDDPVLSEEEGARFARQKLKSRNKTSFKVKTLLARSVANSLGGILNRETEIIGIENIQGMSGGAIVTSNHFSQLDNTVIRKLARRLGRKRINIVSQISNFAMTGAIGFLLNYADTIPITDDFRYMSHELMDVLKSLLSKNELVLIYPEREMWFNYRKPRPGLRGAYYFAAKLNVPVISCFVEMRDCEKMDTDEFHKVKYTLHILPTLYPDTEKNARENSIELMKRDYEQKKEAYERIYGKPLNYSFEPGDIAGWITE